MPDTAIIILAAGASQRLGTPKQQLIFRNKTLLQQITATALATGNPVIVVLGANADNIRKDIAGMAVSIVVNTAWHTGMAGSIQTGLQATSASNVLLLLCDQPFITTTLLQELITTHHHSGKGITACAYNNTFGTPALFSKTYFTELRSLTGQEGAKKIILQNPADVATVSFPAGAIDIDTPADLEKLR